MTSIGSKPPAHALVSRRAAFKHLEGLPTPINVGQLDTFSARCVAQAVTVCFDAREHFIDRSAALTHTQTLLTMLRKQRDTAPTSALRETLAAVEIELSGIAQATLAKPVGAPATDASQQLRAIAQATAETNHLATIPPDLVHTSDNAMLGPILHTGDEVFSAAAHLIKQAESRVLLHTWALYKSSEANKHVMEALSTLQLRQAKRRTAGEDVKPIQVRIVMGCGVWGNGPKDETGGSGEVNNAWLSNVGERSGKFQHGIIPFTVDPTLLDVQYSIRAHRARGAAHTKTLVVDDDLALVTSANVKGSHHAMDNNGAPFHDFAVIMAGPCVHAVVKDFESNAEGTRVIRQKRGTALLPEEVERIASHVAAHLAPTPLAGVDGEVIAAKVATLAHDVQSFRAGTLPQEKGDVVAIARAPLDTLYTGPVDTPQARGLIAALDNAQKSIEINNCNVNAEPFVEAIQRALSRGVTVRILSSENYNKLFFTFPGTTNLNIYQRLANYSRRSNAPGTLQLRFHPDGRGDQNYKASHTKAMFIDEQIAIVGSANMEEQSWKYSGEFNMALNNPAWVHSLRHGLFTGFWDDGRAYLDTNDTQVRGLVESSGGLLSALESVANVASSSYERIFRPYRSPNQIVKAGFDAALASNRLAEKLSYIDTFNKTHAGRLATEEAALERLVMKHARLALPQGTAFNFDIKRNLERGIVVDYGRTYRETRTLNLPSGMRAHLYQSDSTETGEKPRFIIAYEGTTMRSDPLRDKQGVARGFRAALDHRGVGRETSEQGLEPILRWIREAHASGHDVTMTGFSLGGTVAARHFAALTPQERERTRLVTFAAPGLASDERAEIGGSFDARHIKTRLDYVAAAGEKQLPGRVFKLDPVNFWLPWRNHINPSLSRRELNGVSVSFGTQTPGRTLPRSWVEKIRMKLGRLPKIPA